MLNFLKELPDKYLSAVILFVLLACYAHFQTTFFEQAILFILGVVGGLLRSPNQPHSVQTGDVQNQIVTTPEAESKES